MEVILFLYDQKVKDNYNGITYIYNGAQSSILIEIHLVKTSNKARKLLFLMVSKFSQFNML